LVGTFSDFRADIPSSQTPAILRTLFDTYPLYVDTKSRQAVESCLSAIATSPDAPKLLPGLVKAIHDESNKTAIAPGNAFVLIRWSSLLIQHAAKEKEQWEQWGLKAVAALINALNTLFASTPKGSTSATALRVSRRAIRTLLKGTFGVEAVETCIATLTAKAPTPAPKNALVLGIIAGVCKRVQDRAAVVESKKADYFAFYLRDILGSRVQLPAYIANALHDFFSSFVSVEDLKKDVIPAVEKALLRAPEVVLNDLIGPILTALPSDFDLSDILASNLVKPLLANIKSTNVSIREGAVRTFRTLATRSRNATLVEKAADEILTPLKANKITSADQRVLHAEMLAALQPIASLAAKVPQGLVTVTSKEANEVAAAAEIGCISKYVRFALESGVDLDKATVDAFTKGLAEKRMPMRRIWALQLADCIWNLNADILDSEGTATFADATIGKLIDVFSEVLANPLPALQSGQIPVACAAAALAIGKAPQISSLKSASIVKKAAVGDKVLVLEPKPSFLLNPRVYTKLTLEDDLRWFLRATLSAFPGLAKPSDNITLPAARSVATPTKGRKGPRREDIFSEHCR
jgi:hypothetical protein